MCFGRVSVVYEVAKRANGWLTRKDYAYCERTGFIAADSHPEGVGFGRLKMEDGK
jgi:hypothetical protein